MGGHKSEAHPKNKEWQYRLIESALSLIVIYEKTIYDQYLACLFTKIATKYYKIAMFA